MRHAINLAPPRRIRAWGGRLPEARGYRSWRARHECRPTGIHVRRPRPTASWARTHQNRSVYRLTQPTEVCPSPGRIVGISCTPHQPVQGRSQDTPCGSKNTLRPVGISLKRGTPGACLNGEVPSAKKRNSLSMHSPLLLDGPLSLGS